MLPRQYFPLGKAYDPAFCNRTEETETLLGNIQNGKHSFLAAPRRYGKSSLCEKVLAISGLPHVTVDLHLATSEKNLERLILKGILELIGKAVSSIDKALQVVKYRFKNLKPKLAYEAYGFRLELEIINQQASVPETLREALLFLESLLAEKKQIAVLVLDEFQRVAELGANMGIEGGIRSAAQETKYLSFIFSGSNRHLIESIFQNAGRPLYKLCKKIKLQRISEDHYRDHLNIAAQAQWKKLLDEDVFQCIMKLTEQHPYYVNYLCDALWTLCSKKLPKIEDVENSWVLIIEEERSDLLREFFSLGEAQKKLLKYLATHADSGIYTAEASEMMELASTAVPAAVQALLSRDLLEDLGERKYLVINPAYRVLLRE